MKAILVSPSGLQKVTSVQGGRSGTLGTLNLMALHTLDASARKEFRSLVGSILLSAGIKPGATVKQIGAAVQEWTRRRIRFVRDPEGVELLQHPAYLLTTKAGDCDDHSALVAALLLSMGLRVRFKAVARTWPEVFEHVYCQVFDGRQWIALETTLPYGVGREVPDQLSEVVLEVGPELELSGLFSGLKKAVKRAVGYVANPVKLVTDTVGTVKRNFSAAISGAAAGSKGGWIGAIAGAVAGVGLSETARNKAENAAAKMEALARAEDEKLFTEAAAQLADLAGDPSRAAAYEARIKAVADPTPVVEAIVAEIRAEAATKAPAGKSATTTATAGSGRDWWPIGLGVAGLAVSVYAIASQKKKEATE